MSRIKFEELTTKDELIRSLGSLSFAEMANLKQEFNREFIEQELRKMSSINLSGLIIFFIISIILLFIFFTEVDFQKITFSSFTPIFPILIFIPTIMARYKKQRIYKRLLEVS